jgi:transcriptional regulator with XRE-family HTH domain
MAKDRSDKYLRIETLSQYVKRILIEKQFTHKSVEERSEKGITDAYVGSIVNGSAKNPSVDKLKALAVGLDEPEDEVFKVARGLPLNYQEGVTYDPWPGTVLAKAMERIVSSADLTKIVQALLLMSFKDRQAVWKNIESMNKPKPKD